MKLRFYIDFWPGSNPLNGYYAHTQPTARSEGCKRLAFDVAIPDDMIYAPDAVSPEVSRPTLVEDHSDPTP